jgi:hypothetical protein
MSWFSGKNPAEGANKYLEQIPGTVSPYYSPYINEGRAANQDLIKQFQLLLNNPGELYNKLGQGYTASPGYQARLKAALQSGTNAAAAGGMAGSLAHQQAAQQTANDITNEDFEAYLNHVLGLFGMGLEGEKGIGEQGFKSSLGFGDILGSNLAQQGNYAYEGQAAQNAQRASLINNIISGASAIGGAAMGKPR